MLSRDELLSWAKQMFNERELTKEEQEDEIKKFREGVAPLYPSFIINQEKLVDKLQNSFNELYSNSRVMESYVVVGNPGDGKSHILNIVNSYLRTVKNNIVINERTQGFGSKFDMVSLILNKINSPLVLNALIDKIKEVNKGSEKKEIYFLINNISNYFNVSFNLAKLLFKLVYGSTELEQIKALNILTSRDNSQETLLSLDIDNFEREKDILEFFYIMMNILKEKKIFIIILIEELEHIFKWDSEAKLKFYEQLKEFIDNSQKLGNLSILMFSTYVLNDEYAENIYTQDIYAQDKALYSRLTAKVLKIKPISSKEEIKILIEKLIERYKKLYDHIAIDIDDIVNQIDTNNYNKKTYRYYIQSTAAILDQFSVHKNKESQLKLDEIRQEKAENSIAELTLKDPGQKQKVINKILKEISECSSQALKKMILLAIQKLLEFNQYKINVSDLKKAYITALPKNKRNNRLFFLDYSPINKVQEKYSNLISLPEKAEELKCDKNNLYYIYIKNRVTNNAEKNFTEYNPSINLISLKDEDIIELLLLVSEDLEDREKKEVALDLATQFKLEIGD